MILLAAMLLAAPAHHPTPFPTRVGECRWVHGQFAFWNGSGIRRIWVIGTKHLVNLYDWDEDVPDSRFSLTAPGPRGDFIGDFRICARERFVPGHMQHVRLTAVKNLVSHY